MWPCYQVLVGNGKSHCCYIGLLGEMGEFTRSWIARSWTLSRSSTINLEVLKGKKVSSGDPICSLFSHLGKANSVTHVDVVLANGEAMGRASQWDFVPESNYAHHYCYGCFVGQYVSRKRSPGQQAKLARLLVMLTHQAWRPLMELVMEPHSSRRELKGSLFFLCLSVL